MRHRGRAARRGGANTADTIIITSAGTVSGTITLSAALPTVESAVTIEGKGFSVDGDGKYVIFTVDKGDLTINDLTLTNGSAGEINNGGAISVKSSTLSLNSSTVENSEGGSGGGISMESSTATITDSTIRGNTASTGNGGGIRASESTLTITRSAIANNTADKAGSGLWTKESDVTITNSTISGNSVTGSSGQQGGGVYVYDGTVTLTHVTIVDNTADDGTDNDNLGGGLYYNGGTLNLRNSLLSGNEGGDCAQADSVSLNEHIGNLIADGSCPPPVDSTGETSEIFAAAQTASALGGNPKLGKAQGSPAYYPLTYGSPAIDAAADAHCEDTDQASTERPQIDGCDIGTFEAMASQLTPPGDKSSASGSAADESEAKAPSISTCLTLPTSIIVSQINEGTQCQQIDAGGIGIAEVINAGFIDAVDVWGYLGAGVEVCFQNSGSLTFLDAATAPRSVLPLSAYSKEGMTCTWLERAGSVVLVPGPAPAAIATNNDMRDCKVTLNAPLNFRASPGGAIMSTLPQGVTLTALRREESWFEVDFYGTTGWISAAYVTPQGSCD